MVLANQKEKIIVQKKLLFHTINSISLFQKEPIIFVFCKVIITIWQHQHITGLVSVPGPLLQGQDAECMFSAAARPVYFSGHCWSRWSHSLFRRLPCPVLVDKTGGSWKQEERLRAGIILETSFLQQRNSETWGQKAVPSVGAQKDACSHKRCPYKLLLHLLLPPPHRNMS